MKLINLEKVIEYAKEKDYIKTSNQERALREVFALATVETVPIDALDKIKVEIKEERKGYPPSADEYKTINKVLQIIDKHIGGEE